LNIDLSTLYRWERAKPELRCLTRSSSSARIAREIQNRQQESAHAANLTEESQVFARYLRDSYIAWKQHSPSPKKVENTKNLNVAHFPQVFVQMANQELKSVMRTL